MEIIIISTIWKGLNILQILGQKMLNGKTHLLGMRVLIFNMQKLSLALEIHLINGMMILL